MGGKKSGNDSNFFPIWLGLYPSYRNIFVANISASLLVSFVILAFYDFKLLSKMLFTSLSSEKILSLISLFFEVWKIKSHLRLWIALSIVKWSLLNCLFNSKISLLVFSRTLFAETYLVTKMFTGNESILSPKTSSKSLRISAFF